MKKYIYSLLLIFFGNLIVAQKPGTGNIIYVNQNKTSRDGSGDSSANAIKELADTLEWARTQNDFTIANIVSASIPQTFKSDRPQDTVSKWSNTYLCI